MGFQLQDDVIDLITPEKVSGKRQGGDLIEAKKTLMMIHAFANDVPSTVFGKKDATPEQIPQVISLLERADRSSTPDPGRRRWCKKARGLCKFCPTQRQKPRFWSWPTTWVKRQY